MYNKYIRHSISQEPLKATLSIPTLTSRQLLCLCLLIAFSSVRLLSQSALSPRIASYNMDITIDVENKKLKGTTTLEWRNISEQPVDHLLFHMYYNAFRNSESTFMKERGVPGFLTSDIDETCGWAYSEILSATDSNGNSLDNRRYVQPDDNNANDKSVLRMDLAEPVPGGESVIINFQWEAKIPKTMPRTGYNKDYYFMAQWFPKVGVYEVAGMRYAEEDGWNCHQYHSNGEYYSDFGVYDVKLTAPSDYTVAASGQLINKEEKGATTTWRYLAEDVIDFTWTCSPHYVIHKDNYKDTEIALYSYPEKCVDPSRYFNTIKYCMAYLEDHLGPYPYPTLSIIDPPIHGLYTGGMEYPTLITCLSFNCFPAGLRTVETLVVHEYVHQYFMQMVATHEVEDPWMDEGLTTYYEGKILDSYLTNNTSTIDFLGYKAGNREWNRSEFFSQLNPEMGPNTLRSWQYEGDGYGPISYNKTALWLETMEGLIGEEVMKKAMRHYYQKWQFKHPDRNDFTEAINEIIIQECPQFSEGMDWYFAQVLYGTGTCDYQIGSIDNNLTEKSRGHLSSTEDCNIVEEDQSKYNSVVTVHRTEEITIPNILRVHFANGSSEDIAWDGKQRVKTFEFSGDQRIVSAEIDPDKVITLDKNYLNNSKSVSSSKGGIRALLGRLITSTQHILETIAFLI